MIPEMIGRYNIKSELGRGGMAAVYAAHDPLFNRDVAVKVLPRELLHDPKFRARFEREAKTVAALEHPSILPVYDFGEADGQPYFVMRLMSGGSLADRLQNGPVSLEDTLRIVTSIANALDYAHSQGVIHRDLKPGNILFDHKGEPYLADFGIVKLSEAGATLTGNVIVGTPAYMSPEQGRGEKDLDGRSDIYSLGVIVYEMLSGSLPYPADTPMGQIIKHMSAPIPNILEQRKDLPGDIQVIINRALHKRRFGRYATAAELVKDLKAVVAGEKISGDQLAATYITLSGVARPVIEEKTGEPKTQVEESKNLQKYSKRGRGKKKNRLLNVFSFILISSIFLVAVGGIAIQLIIYPQTPALVLDNIQYQLARLGPTPTLSPTTLPTIEPSRTSTATKTLLPTVAPSETPAPTSTSASTPTMESTKAGSLLLPVPGGAKYPLPIETLTDHNVSKIVKLSVTGDGAFYDIAFTSDGGILALGTSTGVRLLEFPGLKDINFLPAQNPVKSLAFSPDDKKLIAAEYGSLVVWDWQNKQIDQTFLTPDNGLITYGTFSADGQTLWGGEQSTYIWRLSDGSLITQFNQIQPQNVSVSVDSQLAVIPRDNSIQVIRLSNDKVEQEFRAYNSYRALILPDNDTVVAFSEDMARFFSLRMGKAIGTIGGLGLVISQDGQIIASHTSEGNLQIWKITESKVPGFPLRSISYRETEYGDYQISPNGEYLISTIWWNGTLRAYDLLDEKRSWTQNLLRSGYFYYQPETSWMEPGKYKILFRPQDPETVVLLWDISFIEIFDMTTDQEHMDISNDLSVIQGEIPFMVSQYKMDTGSTSVESLDHQFKAVASPGKIDITRISDSSHVTSLYTDVLTENGEVAFAPDADTIAFLSPGETVRIWSIKNAKQLCVVNGTGASPFVADAQRLFFSDDSKTLAIYHKSGAISYWVVAESSVCSLVNFGTSAWNNQIEVHAWEISPDGTLIAHDTGTSIDIIQLRSGKVLRRLWGDLKKYQANLGFSSDGKLFGALFSDGTVHVWGLYP